ncbi:MAG: N-acetylmuramoyl-L-alanine amidase [Actinobacteria bacterium]|nr:N-acetylmuramoyl-L-alanine amidase [Actinomycetota bacterium]
MTVRRLPSVLAAAGLTVVVSVTGLSSAGAVAPAGAGHFGEDGQAIAGDYWDAPPQAQPRAWTSNPWPAHADVVARLRAHGLNPVLVPGYDNPKFESNAFLAGSGTSVNAVMMHDTGTTVPASRLNNTHSLNWITYGVKNSKGQTVRASHFYVARDGSVYVVYLGRTWHAGAGDSMFGVPSNKMNGYSYGIEIESEGGGVKDLTAAQFTAASKVAAAALEVSGLGTDRIINHKDYAGRVQGKVDTAYSRSMWQNRIGAEMGVAQAPGAPPESVSSNRSEISMALMRVGVTSEYVRRYQVAMRKFAKKRLRVNLSRVNPNGATGYYGGETKRLTRVVKRKLARSSRGWKRIWVSQPRSLPNRKLVRKIGRTPIA